MPQRALAIVDTAEETEQILVTVPIPRAAITVVAPPPVLLSQRNVEQVTGIPAENYLRMLRSADFNVTIIADGKLRLVEREAFVAWLGKHRRVGARAVEPAEERGAELDDADAIARQMGLAPKQGRGRCRA